MFKQIISFAVVAGLVLALAPVGAEAALIHHYRMNEGSGQTIADWVGANPGTLGDTTAVEDSDPAWSIGGGIGGGNALDFTDDNHVNEPCPPCGDYVTVDFFPMPTDFTLLAWINPDVIGADHNVVYSWGDADTDGIAKFSLSPNGAMNYGELQDGVAWSNVAGSAGLVTSGTLQQVAVTRTASKGIHVFYNGALVGAGALNNNLDASLLDRICIGRNANGAAYRAEFDGIIDDIQVYDTVLAESDIEFLFNNPGAAIPEPSSLVLAALGLLSLAFVAWRRVDF